MKISKRIQGANKNAWSVLSEKFEVRSYVMMIIMVILIIIIVFILKKETVVTDLI